jgi:hypothetical protein
LFANKPRYWFAQKYPKKGLKLFIIVANATALTMTEGRSKNKDRHYWILNPTTSELNKKEQEELHEQRLVAYIICK